MRDMSGHVLLTEDDTRIRAAMRLVLEEEGYAVSEAASGERAAETFAAQPTDVVLVDVMLPGMSGFDLCRKLRETSDVPVIMVTARSDTTDVVSGLEAGADDYVTKPFVPKELLARIAAALRRRARVPSAESSDSGDGHMAFGDLEILPDQGVVRRRRTDLHVSKTG